MTLFYKKIMPAFMLAAFFAWAIPLAAEAAESKPLLQEGKKTLYQRVITHPGASLFAEPVEGGKVLEQNLKTFSVYYVYARKPGWIEVGPSSSQPSGWIEDKKTTDWNQSLTMLFTSRTGRDPVLFFKDAQKLNEICTSTDMEKQLADLQKSMAEAKSGALAPNIPVLAAEPSDEKGAVAASRFYIMPILHMAEPFEGVKFLKVASIDPGQGAKAGGDAKNKNAPRTAVALVIDTTISMKPYIEQSLEVIKNIYDQLEKSALVDHVAFGVVAFRNSLNNKPGLEYTSKVISDFKTAKKRADLESSLAKVEEAKISSHSFAEDSMAGLKTAIDSLSWGDYDSRVIMLISDAGPLPGSDPEASIKMDIPEMTDYARSRGIWITAMHIKSPKGTADHAPAEKSYRSLTILSNNQSNYYAIKASTAAEGSAQFAAATKTLASALVSMVKNTAEGKIMTRPKEERQSKPEDEAARLAATLGYALQLEFLGKRNENRAPSVVEAWAADMDLSQMAANRQVASLEAAVLLSKDQLSDLSAQLNIIIDNAERTKKTDSRDFFQGILSASARMVRNPAESAQNKNLAELGVLGEFLEGLPYKSDIMLLREEDWYRMSVGEQTAFINRLKSRLARYDEYDKDRANWESFGAQNPGDWLYRVPLNMLP